MQVIYTREEMNMLILGLSLLSAAGLLIWLMLEKIFKPSEGKTASVNADIEDPIDNGPTAHLYVGDMLADVKCVYGSSDSAGSVSARVAVPGEPFIIVVKFGQSFPEEPRALILTPTGYFPTSTSLVALNVDRDGFQVSGTGNAFMAMGYPLFYYAVL